MRSHCLHLGNQASPKGIIELDKDEIQHSRSLRIREGEIVNFRSFTGWWGKAKFLVEEVEILETHQDLQENKIFIGVPDKNAQKTCVEHAISMGFGQISFFHAEYCEDHRVNIEKLYLNGKSAQKQCLYTGKVEINLLESSQVPWKSLVGFDKTGLQIPLINNHFKNLHPCIGPPGGLTDKELSYMPQIYSLPSQILKTEVAVVGVCMVFNLLNSPKT